jgi:hypothetical protein
MKLKYKEVVSIGAILFALAFTAKADGPTAFALAKLGDQYVGVQSKDKIVQIRSDKSVGSMTPEVWYVVYYDPDATFKAVEVKFGAGQKMDVSHPFRALEMATDEHSILDSDQLKVDSDKALKIATSQPLLKNLTLRSSKLTLGHGDEGPTWTVQFWASKLQEPDKEADIGVVVLSAKDGSLVKTDLHIDSVN